MHEPLKLGLLRHERRNGSSPAPGLLIDVTFFPMFLHMVSKKKKEFNNGTRLKAAENTENIQLVAGKR